ncbi:monocarboxylate transporter 7-like [Takifugu flavidus]|uniref:monocarboxylate transporter 7-like n=1 Tax=Takifugu flavidus TaxID=433684 RepID=UPI0025446661|nr:monocarboxylate transporter 7-like [Takifugu flavidus]XP_056892623.1 monocarboxylate transporter 7-like [Takifugu flavidus]XP_056892631.1 monocarboxylate transporter 7-like [Takifugu flavidus]XP_056892640.1 monocarboxylate transporter 7-like [Takifugu flavidus]
MAYFGAKWLHFLGPNVYPEAPDGGWGWVVGVAFFLVEMFTYGSIKSFGIFLQDLMEEFRESNSRVSWIVSIAVFVMTFNAPLSSVLTNRFGFQLVVMTGGLLILLGVIATTFTTSVNQIYFTYGLLTGMGYCLTFLPTVTILSQYFTRRRALVTAVASTGESLFMSAMAPALSALKDRMGWRRTMAILGGLQSTIIICGALLRPIVIRPGGNPKTDAQELEVLGAKVPKHKAESPSVLQIGLHGSETELTISSVSTRESGIQSLKDSESSSHPEEKTLLDTEAGKSETTNTAVLESTDAKGSETEKQLMVKEGVRTGDTFQTEKPKLLDFTILRECSFIFYSLFGLFATLGFFAPPLYIIEMSVSRGVEREHAAYMLSIMAVAEIVGRFTIGWILTWKCLMKKKVLVLLTCVITMTVDLVGFTLVTEFYGLAVCCAVYGFLMGTISCTHIPLLAEDDVVGIERMSSAAGVYVFIHSFSGLAGPPLGGLLVDMTHNYGSAFYSCTVGMAIGALFLGLVRPAKRRLLCRRRKPKKHEKERAPEEAGSVHRLEQSPDSLQACSTVDTSLVHAQAEATEKIKEVTCISQENV